MPIAVVGQNGAPTQVATMEDVSGDAYVLPAATTTVLGGVKKSATVAAVPAQTVTDIATAQTAVNTIVTNQNAILTALKAAGIMS